MKMYLVGTTDEDGRLTIVVAIIRAKTGELALKKAFKLELLKSSNGGYNSYMEITQKEIREERLRLLSKQAIYNNII